VSQCYELCCLDCKEYLDDLAQTSCYSQPRPLLESWPIIWFLHKHLGHHLEYKTDLADQEECYGSYFDEAKAPEEHPA